VAKLVDAADSKSAGE